MRVAHDAACRTADESADVAVLPPLCAADQLLLQELAQRRRPQRHIARIAAEDALLRAVVRDLQIRVRQNELAQRRIQGESRHASA